MSNNEEVPIRLASGAITQDCSNVLLYLMMMMVVAVLEVLTALAGDLWYYYNMYQIPLNSP